MLLRRYAFEDMLFIVISSSQVLDKTQSKSALQFLFAASYTNVKAKEIFILKLKKYSLANDLF